MNINIPFLRRVIGSPAAEAQTPASSRTCVSEPYQSMFCVTPTCARTVCLLCNSIILLYQYYIMFYMFKIRNERYHSYIPYFIGSLSYTLFLVNLYFSLVKKNVPFFFNYRFFGK